MSLGPSFAGLLLGNRFYLGPLKLCQCRAEDGGASDLTRILVRVLCDFSGWGISPGFWSRLHAIFRAGFSWAAKALGVKLPSAVCGRFSL